MSTATLDRDSALGTEDALQYRALHTGAIIGFVLAVLSVFTLLAAANSLEGCLMVAPIPILGTVVSFWAWNKIRREPDRYTGSGIALAGFVLSLAFLLGGLGFSSYVYATEVPEGYARISFGGMKPDALDERAGHAIPKEIAALDGKRVFIKGYIRPDSVTVPRGIENFLLVRDSNQCCFGDLASVKYYDQILVNMEGARRVDYHDGIFRMGGILKVDPQNVARSPMVPVFTLTADYAN